MQFYTGQVQVRQNETAACATLEHSPRQRPGCSRLSALSLKHPTKRMAIWEVTGMRMLHERYTTTSDNACLQTALARRLHGSTFRTRLQITTVRSSGWSGKKGKDRFSCRAARSLGQVPARSSPGWRWRRLVSFSVVDTTKLQAGKLSCHRVVLARRPRQLGEARVWSELAWNARRRAGGPALRFSSLGLAQGSRRTGTVIRRFRRRRQRWQGVCLLEPGWILRRLAGPVSVMR